MTFRQRASSKFTCATGGSRHCGRTSGRVTLRYFVDILYTCRSALDHQGFLLDNAAFERYFGSLGVVTQSCEELAAAACAHFTHLLEDRLQHVAKVCVRIFPFDGVYVEASARPAKELRP